MAVNTAPNNFDCYKSDCYPNSSGPPQNFIDDTESPKLSFLARQVGEYTVNLKILDQNEVELSSNDFTINVSNEIPEFSYNNIFTEDFSSIDNWVFDSYSMEQFQVDNPDIGYVQDPAISQGGGSQGGGITINNNSLEVATGTFIYRNATKNCDNLSISIADNIKISTHIQGASFTSSIEYEDLTDYIGDFKIHFNNYKIYLKNETNHGWCSGLGWQREYFLNRYNLANRDLDFYIYYNGSNAPELKVIADNINITERFKIEYNPTTTNNITFHVDFDRSASNGAGITIVNPRTLKLTKLEINKFN